ncbi:hypothetical protein [Hydrogenophaga sp. 2FB]|uniref:hypothetical protein n=1 Tax=Hydrogenophaga sp. 2FB TaxID=2502187 RepID=UPI0010FA4A5C|nr:hypothetical protein [Hydrogenophaga sp. 2FB]
MTRFNTLKISLAMAAALAAGTAMAAAPKAKTCAADATGGIVKEVKQVGSNTVMSFKDSKYQITIPSNKKEAKALAKVKPGTLHCEVDDTDV